MSIYGHTDDTEPKPVRGIKGARPTRQPPPKVIAKNRLRTVTPPPATPRPETLATNVVDLPEEDIAQFKADVTQKTLAYTKFLRVQILPHLLAFDAAIDYSRALLVDGIGRTDVTTDNSLLLSLKWLLHQKTLEFMYQQLQLTPNEKSGELVLELMKTELAKAQGYTDRNTVGVVYSKEKK